MSNEPKPYIDELGKWIEKQLTGPSLLRQLFDPSLRVREVSFVNEPALREAVMIASAAPEEDQPNPLREIHNEIARTLMRLFNEQRDEWEVSATQAKHKPSGMSVAHSCTHVHVSSFVGYDPSEAAPEVDKQLNSLFLSAMNEAAKNKAIEQARKSLEELQRFANKKPVPYKPVIETAGVTLIASGREPDFTAESVAGCLTVSGMSDSDTVVDGKFGVDGGYMVRLKEAKVRQPEPAKKRYNFLTGIKEVAKSAFWSMVTVLVVALIFILFFASPEQVNAIITKLHAMTR